MDWKSEEEKGIFCHDHIILGPLERKCINIYSKSKGKTEDGTILQPDRTISENIISLDPEGRKGSQICIANNSPHTVVTIDKGAKIGR